MKHTDVAKSDKSVESDDEGVTSDDLSDTGNSSKGENRGGVTDSGAVSTNTGFIETTHAVPLCVYTKSPFSVNTLWLKPHFCFHTLPGRIHFNDHKQSFLDALMSHLLATPEHAT